MEGSDSLLQLLLQLFQSSANIPGFIREEGSDDKEDYSGKEGAKGDRLGSDPLQIKEMNMMKIALAQMTSFCSRSKTFKEMLL